MSACHTDCLEKPLSKGFRYLGKVIARHPWWFVVVPVTLSVGFGAGFCFLEERQISNLENQFTPVEGAAKKERDFVRIHFPVNYSGHFSVERMYEEGTFASLVIVSTSDNLLNKSVFEDLYTLDKAVRNLTCDPGIGFHQLCAKVNDSMCLLANPLLAFVRIIEEMTLTYPMFQDTISLGLYLGGVTLGPQNTVLKARALRLLYYLRDENDQERANSLRWLDHFIITIPKKIRDLQLKSIQVSVYYSTSISLEKQLESNTKTVIPYFSITYVVTILFSIASCMRLDNIRNKVWVAAFGVLSPGLAILTSFGLLLICGVPFSITVVNSPFLILGVGVDNMFILISCWQQTKLRSNVEERMADTYQDAAVSITITTLTDIIAFYIGLMTHFPSVQSFCLYSGTALVFCYLYCICFFGAVLALNGRRESENRHWLTCLKVSETQEPQNGPSYTTCCFQESLDATQEYEIEHPITGFFQKYYGPFLTNYWTKLLVFFLYLAYFIVSVFGCVQIQEGIDIRHLANHGSYLTHYFNVDALYFSEYGPRVMVVISNKMDYWEIKTRQDIEACMQELEGNYYVAKEFSVSWLRSYERLSAAAGLNITGKVNFFKHLNKLYTAYPAFKQDLDLHGNEVQASRFFIQTFHLITGRNGKDMLIQLREIAAICSVKLIVYHPIFIYLDQYFIIIQTAIQNIMVATAVMLVISLLFIPNPLCSLWVTFAIISIILGVIGFMGYWKVNLDSISMITLVICIGFSVDSSAHIAYAYVSSKKVTANDRVIDALHVLGCPIVQGASSTVLGILALSVADSYIFKTFFKIMFLVITFGVLHGLIFIPVFLTLLGEYEITCVKKIKPQTVSIIATTEIFWPCPEACENQVRMQELPGYVSPMTCGVNVADLYNFYCYKDWKSGAFMDVTENGVKVEDEYKNTQLQYRRRMLQLYLEGKIDPDCP
uniref:Patched domain-containing protein 3 n=1 Tax=Leptobrachium leishanense TaxID=445787 RepID=A0A8C5Q1N4_9ANUR